MTSTLCPFADFDGGGPSGGVASNYWTRKHNQRKMKHNQRKVMTQSQPQRTSLNQGRKKVLKMMPPIPQKMKKKHTAVATT